MNNESVAWIIQDKYGRPALSWKGEPISYNAISVEQGDIPLYTHPAKTLTDTEIVRISETCDLNHVLGLIDFARAILKKASETCNGFCGEQECRENQDSCKRVKKASEK